MHTATTAAAARASPAAAQATRGSGTVSLPQAPTEPQASPWPSALRVGLVRRAPVPLAEGACARRGASCAPRRGVCVTGPCFCMRRRQRRGRVCLSCARRQAPPHNFNTHRADRRIGARAQSVRAESAAAASSPARGPRRCDHVYKLTKLHVHNYACHSLGWLNR